MEQERLKKLYDTDKESWKEQMYELQQKIDKLQVEIRLLEDNRNYLNDKIDKAIEYMERRDLEWGSEEHEYMMKLLKGEVK